MNISKRVQQQYEAVSHKHREELLRKTNVVGVGVSEKLVNGQHTGRPSLTIYVEKKLPPNLLSAADKIDSTIDGVETDVVETGKIVVHSNTSRLRPAIGGISIGHVNVTAGTLGCLLQSEADGRQYILSNNHVLANSNLGLIGDAVIQPGRADGGSDPADRIGTLYRFPVVSQIGDNLVDCALARPTAGTSVRAVTLDAWTDVRMIPGWFGSEDQGGGVAVADINGSGLPDLIVFHLDNPGGENHGYYRIGWNLDGSGNVTGGWSSVKAVPGWFGAEDQGAGIAIADVSGNGQPDLIVFHLDNPGGENHGYYRIGWNLNANGDVTGGWSPVMAVPGWFGAEDQGASVSIADIDGNGRPEMFIFHIDNPSGENHGYYRIGWNMTTDGTIANWSSPTLIPGWFGSENQGGGLAVTDVTGTGRPEMIVFHIDNPAGENIAYYRIGQSIRADGTVTSWSDIRQVSGWCGSQNQGGAIAAADINGDGRADLVSLILDNPVGENHGYYRVGFNLARSGDFVASLTGWAPAALGNPIWKSGRTTELKNGSITGVSATITVGNGSGGTWGRFTDQLVIQPAISSPGDSGSAVVNAQNKVVGLLFAGSSTTTIVNRIENVLEAFRWGDVKSVPGWFGAENQGADIASFDITGNGQPDLVVFHIDNPGGENHGYYRVGFNLDANGTITGGWSNIKPVPGWFGSEDQGAGIAIGDISGNGQPDLVIFHVDNPGGENHGYYRIGWNLDAAGNVTGGWSDIKAVPGWFGAEDQGAAIALADINGNGRLDLVVFHIDNPGGENHGYYRIGWSLDTNGNVTGGWSTVIPVPNWFGAENQGAGIAIRDISGNGRPDLLIFHIDNPGGENHGYYRIGWNLNTTGIVTDGWSNIKPVPGWFGAEDQGAGLAITDLNGNGRPDLILFHVDNPSGENHGYYRVIFDLMPSGEPARWVVAQEAPITAALRAGAPESKLTLAITAAGQAAERAVAAANLASEAAAAARVAAIITKGQPTVVSSGPRTVAKGPDKPPAKVARAAGNR